MDFALSFCKVDATDASYPSVNTCVHYLKLPEYSSEEIMRDRLLAATMEKGFHLNWEPPWADRTLKIVTCGTPSLVFVCWKKDMAFLPLAVCSLHSLGEALSERVGVMPFLFCFYLFSCSLLMIKMVSPPGMTDWLKTLSLPLHPGSSWFGGQKKCPIFAS